MDIQLLALMGNRKTWETYARHVRPSSLTEEAATILSAIGEWYESNPEAQNIAWDGFGSWFSIVRHARMAKDRLAIHKALIQRAKDYPVVEAEAQPLLKGLAIRDVASRVGDAAMRLADGDASITLDQIQDMLEEHDNGQRHRSLQEDLGNFSLDAFQKAYNPGLKWRLWQLNESAGDLRKGDFVLFGKRPDVGGTSMLASEVTFMAEQLEHSDNILWANNEEEGNKVRTRIVQAAVGAKSDDLEDHMAEYFDEYVGLMGGNKNRIRVFDRAKMHYKDVEQLCKDLQPKLIVFDQLWKVQGMGPAGEVETQTKLANWARELAKEYAPVIAVHQLGGDAENVAFPTQDMLYGSKTGIPGEVDLMVMLGRKWDKGNTRYLWCPKNKMLTPGDRTKRNWKYEVLFHPDEARFT